MSQIRTLDVTIMGRDLRIACPEEEEPSLRQAVDYLDEKMQQIRATGKVIGIDRIAIMAALNISNELLTTRVGGDAGLGEVQERLRSMSRLIDGALADEPAA